MPSQTHLVTPMSQGIHLHVMRKFGTEGVTVDIRPIIYLQMSPLSRQCFLPFL